MSDETGAVIAAILAVLMAPITINTIVVGGFWLIATPFYGLLCRRWGLRARYVTQKGRYRK